MKNIFHLCVAVGYCAFWFGFVAALVGTMTSGPNLVTWWEAIWIPFVMSVFPILLGMSVIHTKKEL